MAEPADINVDELRRRARRRLVGAVVLALGVAVVVPMLLETEQKPLGDDVSVKIPPVDDGKFVNRLNEPNPAPTAPPANPAPAPAKAPGAPAASAVDATAKSAAEAAPAQGADAPARTGKYDTRIPESAAAASGTTPEPEPAKPAPASAATPTSAVGASPKAADAAKTAPPAHPAPAAAAEPRAANDATSGAGAADHASATPSAPHEGFAVQLAAFADDKGANSLAGRLKRAGYAAYTEPLKTSKGTLWRVRVGPYPSREAALAVRDKLKTEGQSGIVAALR